MSFQLLGGSSDIIQFKAVLLAAFISLLMTSKLGTEISCYVSKILRKFEKFQQSFAFNCFHQVFKMSEDLFSIEWNELPLEMKKYLLIMLPLMQKPLTLTGYGILECNWITFSSVFFDSFLIFKSKLYEFYFRLLRLSSRLYFYFGSLFRTDN